MTPIRLETPKVCSCGRVHKLIPANAKRKDDCVHFNGWYWQCECGSTLFWPKRKLGLVVNRPMGMDDSGPRRPPVDWRTGLSWLALIAFLGAFWLAVLGRVS